MESISNAEILLSIITFIIVLVGALFAVALFYIIKVLHDIKKLADIIKEGGEVIRDDAKELYHKLKSEKNFWRKFLEIFLFGVRKKSFLSSTRSVKKSRKKTNREIKS